QHVSERAIPAILLRTEPIAMLDARAPATQAPRPRAELEIHAGLAEHVATPAVVIAREHRHGYARVAQVHERGQHADPGAWHHGLPLEPELEQIAVDQERCGAPGQRAKERQQQTLGGVRGVAEMDVRDDVRRRGKHAVSLHAGDRLYKRVGGGHTSPRDAHSEPRESMPLTHATELRVRYAETDRMGVVYYANFL